MFEQDESFAAQLRRLRLQAGLTQEALAERAGLATNGVAALERGQRRQPYPHTVGALARALELPPEKRFAFVEAAARPHGARLHAEPARVAAPPSNLPARRTALIGREREVAQLRDLLTEPAVRLVTVTGTGGVGKTSLALQVARDVHQAFHQPDGAWLVELAQLADPALVARTAATVLAPLGVRFRSGTPPIDALIAALRTRRLLLVLDNCEHLVSASAALADRLLDACPAVQIVATSREPLLLSGERQLRLSPLAAPDLAGSTSPDELARYPAVRLFVERAQATASSFALTVRNAPAVAGVCARLDGLPLALELAAAWVGVLAPEQVLERLHETSGLLARERREAPARQQTLQATLDWSHALLSRSEQLLFRRLAVFAGGFGLEAAVAVCAGGDVDSRDVLGLLGRLIEKSLVVAMPDDDATRYRLLDTVRAYAGGRLAEASAGEAEGAQARHAAWYLAFAERVPQDLIGPDEATWYRRVDREAANFQAALAWTGETTDRGEAAVRLGAAMARLRRTQGQFGEARALLEAVLGRPGAVPSATRARALAFLGHLAFLQRDPERAEQVGIEAVDLARVVDDPSALAYALRYLGASLLLLDEERARPVLEEAVAVARAAADRGQLAPALMHLGSVLAPDRPTIARKLFEEAIVMGRQAGDRPTVAVTLGYQGLLALAEGDEAVAQAFAEEASTVADDIAYRDGRVQALYVFGAIAGLHGDEPTADECFGAALRIVWAEGHLGPVCAALEWFAWLDAENGRVERGAQLCRAVAAACAVHRLVIPRLWRPWWAREPAASRAGAPRLTAAWGQEGALTLAQAVALVGARDA